MVADSDNDVEGDAHAFSHLVMAFEECFSTAGDVAFSDILGALYMMLDLGNSDSGQFFTPYEVSRLMAGINMTSVQHFDRAQQLHDIFIVEVAVLDFAQLSDA